MYLVATTSSMVTIVVTHCKIIIILFFGKKLLGGESMCISVLETMNKTYILKSFMIKKIKLLSIWHRFAV